MELYRCMLVTVENKMATDDPFLSTLPYLLARKRRRRGGGRSKQGLVVKNRRET